MFKLRKDARLFFSRIEPQLSRQSTGFEMYYFCLVAGVTMKRKVPLLADFPSTDQTDGFPGDYAARSEILISLMLSSEIERLGIDDKDRASLNREVGKLIDPRTASYLSSDGLYAMNAYSFAGCDVLRKEWFDEPPASLDFFLVRFKSKVDEVLCRKSPHSS